MVERFERCDGASLVAGPSVTLRMTDLWSIEGERTSAAKAALPESFYGTAEAVPLTKDLS